MLLIEGKTYPVKVYVADAPRSVIRSAVCASLPGFLQIDQELPSEDAKNRRVTGGDQDN